MGTFMGHVIPGSAFIAYAIYWTISVFSRYFQARYRRGPAFKSAPMYPCVCCIPCCACAKSYPIEGAIKLFPAILGIIGEIVTALDDKGQFKHVGNGQHATMFFVFGFSGVIDLLRYYGTPLPKRTENAYGLLCFLIEGVLFTFHLHHRSMLDVTLHTLLIYVIWGCAISIVAEAKWPDETILAFARPYCVFLQGTWFCQVAFILYPPMADAPLLDGKNHEAIMVATIIFAWHMFFVFLIMACIGVVIGRYHYVRSIRPRDTSFELENEEDGINNKGSYLRVAMQDNNNDPDSDAEVALLKNSMS